MGEKVILREQVKELFNKKYGQYKHTALSFTLIEQTCSGLTCFNVCRRSSGSGSTRRGPIQADPSQSRLSGGVRTAGRHSFPKPEHLRHHPVGEDPPGSRRHNYQYQNTSTVCIHPVISAICVMKV